MYTGMMQVNELRVTHASQQQVSINCYDPSGNMRKEKSKLTDKLTSSSKFLLSKLLFFSY
jgi:hypothetical protein